MRPPSNLAGQVFGRLTAVSYAGHSRWVCACNCGNRLTVRTANLNKGLTRSCGCLQRELAAIAHTTHGQTGSPTFFTWSAMRARCKYSTVRSFEHYGGRGITVCGRWATFENFLADMGERPAGTSIDRVNPNGNYEPSNCRWATIKEQRANRAPAFGGEEKEL